MTFLYSALQALPRIASNGWALAAYALTIASWTIIAWRVNRMRALLKTIRSLRPDDRVKVLRMEMGAVLPDTVSPEQWLRSRKQKFVFGGIILAGVIVLALAIALPLRPEVENFSHVHLGALKSAVEARLGPPSNALQWANFSGAE